MSLFLQFELVLFRNLAYVDSMYLVRVTPPINYSFSDDSLFFLKILAGDINSLNLLVCVTFVVVVVFVLCVN